MTAVIEHRYRPVGSAAELFRCRQPEVVLSGAAGTGKSRACLEKMHAMCLANPGMRALVCRKTATSLASTALVTWTEIVAKEALASGEVKYFGGSPQGAPGYIYGNGAVIVIGGMDKASRIMSSEYDAIYVQEATELTEDDWETLTTRLRNGKVSFQQLLADCNPGPPQHWLNQRCQRGQTVMVSCKHEDNPRLYDDGAWTPEGRQYLDRLEALTGVRYLRLRKGLWAAAEGLVYDTWDPSVHMYKQILHPPQEWIRYLSVDFGYRNPFCAQWWAEDPDGRLYMYKEVYRTGRLVEDHAKVIAKHMKTRVGKEPPFHAVICDHDAEDRATLERHLDVATTAATKTVSDGIQAVQARLKPGGDGKPGLYLCRQALVEEDPALKDAHKPLCTADEIAEYVWDCRPVPGAGTPREAPAKENDHGMDAMRYMVAYKDITGYTRFRSFYT